MDNEVKVFNNETFGEVRTIIEGAEVWFVAKDVCTALDLSNSRMAIEPLDDDDKGVRKVYSLGGMQNMSVINESGLYTLVLRSNKPVAKQFRKWVTSEVLPSIRKTGMYAVDDLLDDPDLAIKAFTQLKLERQARKEAENRLAEATPKVEYYDALVDKKASTSFRTTAKELHIKERVFITALLEDKFVYRDGKKQLCPYAEYVSSGIFEVKEWQAADKAGVQTLITVKGKELFLSKYKHLQSIEIED